MSGSTVTNTYRYDASGRLVEHVVVTETHDEPQKSAMEAAKARHPAGSARGLYAVPEQP